MPIKPRDGGDRHAVVSEPPPVFRLLAKALILRLTDPRLRNMYEVRWDAQFWLEELPIPCVYAILLDDGGVYIGHTKNIFKRKRSHDWRLRRQTHPNYVLRDACPRGIDDQSVRLFVLEEIEDEWTRRLHERWWHDRLPNCINRENDRITAEVRAFL